MTVINTCSVSGMGGHLSRQMNFRVFEPSEKKVVEAEVEICTDDFVEPTIYVNHYYPCGITSYYEQLRKYSKFKIEEISTPDEIKNRETSLVVLNDSAPSLKDEVDIQVGHFSEIIPWGEDEDYQEQIKNARIIICVQGRIKKIIKKWLREKSIEKEIVVVPACYDIPKLKTDLFYDKYGLKDFILSSAGGERKRPWLFIELAKMNQDKQFVISREKDICPDLPNLHCIGFEPREIYLSAVAACKMFICTSRSEGTPYVILEALSQGKTIITSDYGGELVIEDGESGYVFDGTIKHLDKVFKHALKHPTNGIDRLKEKYYSPKVIKELDAHFSSLYPLVSVCVPNYNGAMFLEQSLQSTTAQNYPNIELIIADSNSTDHSSEILEKYAHMANTTVIYQPERTSIAGGLNECLGVAKGRYFIPWHSDDVMLPIDSITRRVLEMERRPSVGMVYGILKVIDANNREIDTWDRKEVTYNDLKRWNPLTSPSTMFRMDAVIEVGGYDREILHGEDYYINMLVSKHYPLLYLPFVVAHYRQHPDGDSMGRDYSGWDKMIREKVEAG